MFTTITREALKRRLDAAEPVILVEALPEKYYTAGHLPGARLFPHDQAELLAPRLLTDKTATIIVYCASATCRNSHIAAETLERLGYRNVLVYPGGKQDWKVAGLPLES